MEDFYISVAVVFIIAAICGFLLRAKPRRIFYVIIVANIIFAIEGTYFFDWLLVLPCLFIIAFITVIMNHPQMRKSGSTEM